MSYYMNFNLIMFKVRVVWLVFYKFGLNILGWEISPGLFHNATLVYFLICYSHFSPAVEISKALIAIKPFFLFLQKKAPGGGGVKHKFRYLVNFFSIDVPQWANSVQFFQFITNPWGQLGPDSCKCISTTNHYMLI